MGVSDGSFGSQPMVLTLQNTTFIKGNASLTHSSPSGTWSVFDNVFESTTVAAGGSVTIPNGRNGYKRVSVLTGSAGNDVVLTVADFQTGPLGAFYYNTTQQGAPAVNTFYLINKDTVNTPASVGLYHHTTRPDQQKDGATPPAGLDIGFHYVATVNSSSTTPVDTDSDGWPDWQEDANGDALVGASETSGSLAGDTGIWVKIAEPKTGRNIP